MAEKRQGLLYEMAAMAEEFHQRQRQRAMAEEFQRQRSQRSIMAAAEFEKQRSNGHYSEDYQRALKRGVVKVAYARIVHLGAGGVGKSSFQRGMMNLPLPDKANSTQMAELGTFQPGGGGASRDVTRHTAKGISGEYWMPVTEDDETDELVGLVRLVYNVSSGKTASSRVLEWLSSAASYIHGAWSGNPMRSEAQKVMDEIIKLAQKNPNAQAPEFEVFLYVWDCGGQQVFQCILPAFLTPKSLFFLMFDARKDLHDRCLALTHRQGHASEQVLEQSTIELLLQWMSCIDATLTDKDFTPDASTTKIPEYPRILPIGTHGDDPSVKDRKESILEQLYTEYQDKEYAHLVREKGVIIDNTTAGLGENADPGYKKVIHIVNDFAYSNRMKVDTPLTWVLFRKVLRMMAKNKPYFTLKEVEEIAEACTIPEESVSSLLKFYHDLAVFLHYKKIPSLSSIVIADPQWLIKQIAKLLALEGFEMVRLPRLWGILRKYGILVETLYTEIWKAEEFSSHLSPQSIVDLLEHFLIVAPVNTHGKVHNYKGREYFVPSVLPPLPSTQEGASSASPSHERNLSMRNEASMNPPSYERKAASLHLVFPDIKYLPPGFFTRLATTLSKEEGYNIAFGHGIYRNRVSFILGHYDSKIDTLVISECKVSVQIDLMRDESRKSGIPIFSNVCWKVIDTIRRCSTDIVCQWFPGMKTSYAFHCDCYGRTHSPETPEPEPHFVLLKLEYTIDAIIRCQKDQVYRLTKDQKYWLRIAKPCGLTSSISVDEKRAIAQNIQENQKLSDFKSATEMTMHRVQDPVILIDRWIQEMEQIGVPPRPYLIHHLECIGMEETAEKIKYPDLGEASPSNPSNSVMSVDQQDVSLENLTMADHFAVTQELRDLSKKDLYGVGEALGLNFSHLRWMKYLLDEMVAAWLREDDNIRQATGPPTWDSLAAALESTGHNGIAFKIRKEHHLIQETPKERETPKEQETPKIQETPKHKHSCVCL